jgi:hypothetical protein
MKTKSLNLQYSKMDEYPLILRIKMKTPKDLNFFNDALWQAYEKINEQIKEAELIGRKTLLKKQSQFIYKIWKVLSNKYFMVNASG